MQRSSAGAANPGRSDTQLARAHRVTEPFDAPYDDVFMVESEIASRVAQALKVVLGDTARRRLAERPTASLAAYDAYLRGEAVSEGHGMVIGASPRPRGLGRETPDSPAASGPHSDSTCDTGGRR